VNKFRQTTVGLKLPEDGLNTNWNAQQQDLLCQQRNTVCAQQLVNIRVA